MTRWDRIKINLAAWLLRLVRKLQPYEFILGWSAQGAGIKDFGALAVLVRDGRSDG